VHAGLAQLAKGRAGVAGLQVDASATICHDPHVEAELARVQGGELHAIIGGQAEHIDLARPALFQKCAEACRLLVTVVEEAAIAVDFGIGTFPEDGHDLARVELFGKVGARGILDAVDGPEHLRQSAEHDELSRFAAEVIFGEAPVIGGVPVLGRDDALELGREPVGDGDDGVAVWHGQLTSRQKVILNVDQDESGRHVIPRAFKIRRWRSS
jgi:hypothetical protein